MILLDTNIFLELLQRRRQAPACKKLMDALSGGELDGVVTRYSIHSIDAILGRNSLDVAPFLRAVEQTSGLTVYDTTTAEEVEVSLLGAKIRRDFDDSMQYFVAKHTGAEAIVSLDKHFDGLDIPRVEPGKFLQG